MREESGTCIRIGKIKLRKHLSLVLIVFLTYLVVLSFYVLYTQLTNTGISILISDQLFFYNRGKGVLWGKIPYRDFSTNAAPLSSYLWAPIIFLSMILTGDYSPDLITVDNFHTYASMMFSSYLFRIFFALCLLISVSIFYKLLELKNIKKSFWIALSFGINPFFLYLISLWGSDECLLPLLILLPIYLFEKDKNYWAIICIAIGTGLKYIPVLLALLIWIYNKNWKRRIIQSLFLIGCILVIYVPFYFAEPTRFLQQFNDPIVSPGNQGILTIIQSYIPFQITEYSYIFTILTIIFLGITSLYLFVRRETWSFNRLIVILAVYLILYPKLQFSYIVLLFPFVFTLIFTNKKLRWIGLMYLITGMAGGETANILIKHDSHSVILEVVAWFNIVLFYVALFLILFLFLFNRTVEKTTLPLNEDYSLELDY